MTLFDGYLMVDWSARSTPSPRRPSPDAIWVGERNRGSVESETYPRTRETATADVRERLVALVAAGRRVLVGVDVPYGYPAGLAAALGLRGARPWRALWNHLGAAVRDAERNANNRFAVASGLNARIGGGPGPFWGCPPAAATPALTATMRAFAFPYPTPAGPLARLRATERAIGGVQETWKLLGAGSVGSQALLGIPRVRSLRHDPALAEVSRVWPFETGFRARPLPPSGPAVLHVEIWPGILAPRLLAAEQERAGGIRDRAQVRLMCRWAAEHDAAGTLGAYLAPAGLAEPVRRAAVAEEGWILGRVPSARYGG